MQKSGQVGANQRERGRGRREKTKKLFLPSPPLSPSITLTPTRRAAISTLPKCYEQKQAAILGKTRTKA